MKITGGVLQITLPTSLITTDFASITTKLGPITTQNGEITLEGGLLEGGKEVNLPISILQDTCFGSKALFGIAES